MSEVERSARSRSIYGGTGLERRFPFLRFLYPPWQGRKTKECRRVLAAALEEAAAAGGRVLNLGSGSRRYGDHVVNIELFSLPEVDLVADVAVLPLADCIAHGVILEHVLEHVPDPARVMGEVARVLQPNGWVYVESPFMVPYHEGPYDFRRWTLTGLRELCGTSFEVEREGVAMGPGTAAMHLAREGLATLLGRDSLLAYRFWRVVTGWLTVPLKYADGLLSPGSRFRHMTAAALYIVFRRHSAAGGVGMKGPR